MKQRLILIVIFLVPVVLHAREITVKGKLNWQVAEETVVEGKIINQMLICSPCLFESKKENLPIILEKIKLGSGEYIRSVRFISYLSEPISGYGFSNTQKSFISSSLPSIDFSVGTERNQRTGIVSFLPVILKNGSYEGITYFELEVNIEKSSVPVSRNNKAASFSQNSVLSSGEWYKIAVDHNAVYKLSYRFLQQHNIDPASFDPRTISIFGNGGAMLPRKNSDVRIDDLMENAILVYGESDGKFDKNDYILFYGENPHKWAYDQANEIYKHTIHAFSDTTYYFLRIGGPAGKRVSSTTNTGTASVNITEFDDYKYHESDKVNILKSGDDWLGEPFDIQDNYDFTFSFPNMVSGSQGTAVCSVTTASRVVSTYTLQVAGSKLTIDARTAPGTYGARYAQSDGGTMNFSPSGNVVSANLKYNKPPSYSSAKGWLDYLEVNVRRKLIMSGTQMAFRDANTIGNNQVKFQLNGASSKTRVWEITDILNPVEHIGSLKGSEFSFVSGALVLRQYIAMNDFDSTFLWRGKVNNQNLHAENSYDYIIVSHPNFLSAAERLKSFHESNGLSVFITTPRKIYNEFSSGAQDIVAIRDFFRMIYQRSSGSPDQLKYVLFMGDGSYDNKYRIGGNTNFIPTFESGESYDPTESYVTDDFYCLMDSNEGYLTSVSELLDIGIGRIPVQSVEQANKVVDKIDRYVSAPAMSDWRNNICFVADDGDNNIHMRDADGLAKMVDTIAPEYNIEKIFIDAFKQYSTPGGERYPDAQEAISRQVQKGVLIINYTGHGGEVGWAHERILTMDDINNWDNKYTMPLFVTATCEFSRWDDPQRSAGGEVVLLNPDGGGIALLTTVRLVYSFANQQLTESFYNRIFTPVNGEMPHLGDVYREVKNSVPLTNSRNFTLLGDPALKLAYPIHIVVTDSINGNPVNMADTFGALGLVEIKGHLENVNGQKLSNYNGTIYPTVFDKISDIQTLNNDGGGAFNFKLQNKRLFKGKAGVVNGEFSFKFIIPKDIAYNFGNGRLSYYGENQLEDANGLETDFIVGGTDANAPDDQAGPDIELYMNDESFIYGGITDENPLFLAKVYDLHGINMAGTGIGHDITVVLDGKTEEAISLNDYYSAVLNSYQEGEVKYPFENLAEGPHKLTFKVWDVYNNSGEATLEFVVQKYKEITIDKVLNYPNPFTTHTSFWFEHNQPNTVLDVSIQIFTVSGKVVKTIDQVIETTGYNQNLKNPIQWNGRDEYGDKLGRGVYVYKLQVRSRRNGSQTEKIEKLVIL